MIHEGENLKEWMKNQGHITKIAKEVGIDISWLNRRFKKITISTVDKNEIIAALSKKEGIDADISIFSPKPTITQTNKSGQNINQSEIVGSQIGSEDKELIELRVENEFLKKEVNRLNKDIEFLKNLLTNK